MRNPGPKQKSSAQIGNYATEGPVKPITGESDIIAPPRVLRLRETTISLLAIFSRSLIEPGVRVASGGS